MEKEKKDDFLLNKSINKYIDKSIDNFLVLKLLGTLIKDNLDDKYNHFNFRVLSKR